MLNADVALDGSGNFDLGLVGGDASLGNVATYTFVETGGLADFDDASGVAPGGTYNANIWGGGGSGLWTLTIDDIVGGDPASIGSISIDVEAVPEPTSAVILLGMVGVAVSRRRR